MHLAASWTCWRTSCIVVGCCQWVKWLMPHIIAVRSMVLGSATVCLLLECMLPWISCPRPRCSCQIPSYTNEVFIATATVLIGVLRSTSNEDSIRCPHNWGRLEVTLLCRFVPSPRNHGAIKSLPSSLVDLKWRELNSVRWIGKNSDLNTISRLRRIHGFNYGLASSVASMRELSPPIWLVDNSNLSDRSSKDGEALSYISGMSEGYEQMSYSVARRNWIVTYIEQDCFNHLVAAKSWCSLVFLCSKTLKRDSLCCGFND